MLNYIVREVEPELTDFSYYFDDDGLKESGGDYCRNLFIVAQSRDYNGFNSEEYNRVKSEMENLLDNYIDIESKSDYAQYSSVSDMLLDYKLIDNIKNTSKIEAHTKLFNECCEKPKSPYGNYQNKFDAFTEEMIAKYLTIKTSKEWDTDKAYGYYQGDVVKIIYCKEYYENSAKYYGEVWLGAAKEFSVITVDEDEIEIDSCYGYIVSDSQAFKDSEYKRLVCEMAGIDESESKLEMIDGSKTYIKYTYRTA